MIKSVRVRNVIRTNKTSLTEFTVHYNNGKDVRYKTLPKTVVKFMMECSNLVKNCTQHKDGTITEVLNYSN